MCEIIFNARRISSCCSKGGNDLKSSLYAGRETQKWRLPWFSKGHSLVFKFLCFIWTWNAVKVRIKQFAGFNYIVKIIILRLIIISHIIEMVIKVLFLFKMFVSLRFCRFPLCCDDNKLDTKTNQCGGRK